MVHKRNYSIDDYAPSALESVESKLYRKLVSKSDMQNRKVPKRIGALLIALMLMSTLSSLMSSLASAQTVGATVSGTVTDTSGAVVANGQLAIKNLGTGVTTRVVSNTDGLYTAPNLIPGNYQITVTAPGFRTEVRAGIVLEVGQDLVQNIALKAGNVTETVVVTAAAQDIQLSSPTISSVVPAASVVDLPLNGRSWTDLTSLQAGTAQLTTQQTFSSTTQAAQRAARGFGVQVSVGGARPSQNNYRLGGISINDYANGTPANALGETEGVDAIQEFSVLTTNYGAEYGMTSGGVVNAITRSGTNDVHGTAYEFLRNSALDARNYFDAAQIPPFRRNQFGASLGGPIRKNHTFFFANYEGLRQLQGVTIVNIVPSAAARAGQLCSQPSLAPASSPCTTNTVAVDPAATAYLPFYPLPDAGYVPNGNGDTGYYNFADPQITSDNFFTTRIDHQISDKDHVDGTFLIARSPLSFPDNFDNVILGFFSNREVLGIEETHIFNTNLVNNARVGAFRQNAASSNSISANNPLSKNTSLGSQPGEDAARVSISGIANFGGGFDAEGLQVRSPTNYQFYDDVSWIRGKHALKYGFAFERQDFNINSQALGGIWTFGSLANFLTNVPTSYTAGTDEVVSPERGIRETSLGGYLQDDWTWRPNVTVNLGLRYEMSTIPTEVQGYWATLPTLTSNSLRVGNPFLESNPTLHDFEPRLGFAWDPFHNGKTSIRGGFGLFDSMPLPYEWVRSMSNVAPFALQYSANKLPAGAFYSYSGVEPYLTASTLQVDYIEQHPSRTYIMQRNFSIQRELAPNLTATVSYVGSHGLHMPLIVSDANSVRPTQTSTGLLYPNPIGSGTKVNPNYGDIEAELYISGDSYNSLQAQVAKRLSHGVQFEGSFTWAKSMDNSSTSVGNNDFTSSIYDPFYFENPLPRSLSDFNVARTGVINGLWDIPHAKLPRIADKVVNGWELNGIYSASDGMPFTPTWGTGGNVAGFNNSASTQNDYPDRLKGPGCGTAVHPQNAQNYVNLNCFSLPTAPNQAFWTVNCDHTSLIFGAAKAVEPYPYCFNLVGNAGRNSLNGPGQSELDVSAFKNNHIRENINAQFRAEVFNILNRANFAPPSFGSSTDLYNANGVTNGSAGQLTTTSTSSREIQLALKVIF